MNSPKSPSGSAAPTDKDVQAVLVRYRCPTPLHVLRTLMLGHIASPSLDISPMALLAQAWGGDFPEFASPDEAGMVIGVLLNGLWNRLSEHQSTRKPFRLPHFEVAATRQAVHDLALLRAQELKGFADGLFGADDDMLLPEKAHEALTKLAEMQAFFDGAAALLADESKLAPAQELKGLLRNLQQMTIAADEQINKTLQSCKRARGQRLEALSPVVSRRMSPADPDESRVHDLTELDDEEPDFVESPLSQNITRNGVAVRVDIYGDSESKWILEIIDADKHSHVWHEQFRTDQDALDEALRALDQEPLEFFGSSGAMN